MKELKVINTVEEFIGFVRDYYLNHSFKKHLFFRGVPNKDFDLLPSVFRIEGTQSPYSEKDIFLDFMQYAPANNIVYDFVKDCDKVLSDMQHFGMPTRLLDWTVNPLIALYFACQTSDSYNDGRVYVFDPWRYNRTISSYGSIYMNHDINIYARSLLVYDWNNDLEIEAHIKHKYLTSVSLNSDLKMDLPFAYVSPFSNNRKLYQRGCFIIYGKDRTPFNKMKQSAPFMDYVTVKLNDKAKILDHLNLLYVNDYSVYPDYVGMSGMIRKYGSLFNTNKR